MDLIQVSTRNFLVTHAYNSSRDTDNGTVRRYFLYNNRSCSDLGILSIVKEPMTFAPALTITLSSSVGWRLPCSFPAPQGYSLIQCNIITQDCSLADDNAASMVDKKPLSNGCSHGWISIPVFLTPRCDTHRAKKIVFFQIQLMCNPVMKHYLKAWIQKYFISDLIAGSRSFTTLISSLM